MDILRKYIVGIFLVLIFLIIYIYLHQSGDLNYFYEIERLKVQLVQLGSLGPFLIVLLMAGAIVMSPIPSAPIAITSGLLYGHSWGTVYILIGAELGALIAFSISRFLGHEVMQKRFGERIKSKWLTSNNHLMFVVFVSRLIPFISFDIISYAAGLTKISYIQFALATLAGILPASFLLAHFGGEMVSDDSQRMFITILLLGALTLIPIILTVVNKVRRNIKLK